MGGILAAAAGISPNLVLAPGLKHRYYNGYISSPSAIDSATPYQTTIDTSTISVSYFTSANFTNLWAGYYLAPSTGNITVTLSLDFQDDSLVQGYVWVGSTAQSGYSAVNALIDGFGSATVSMLIGQLYPVRVQFAYDGYSGFFDSPDAGVSLSINGASNLSGRIDYNTLTTSGI